MCISMLSYTHLPRSFTNWFFVVVVVFVVFVFFKQEREKLREEKRKYMEYLKQWSKPREDMECDDLKVQ